VSEADWFVQPRPATSFGQWGAPPGRPIPRSTSVECWCTILSPCSHCYTCKYVCAICINYNIVHTDSWSVAVTRVSTEAVNLYSVLSSVKPILTSRQRYAVTRRFIIRTLILKATYVWTFWGLLYESDQFYCCFGLNCVIGKQSK